MYPPTKLLFWCSMSKLSDHFDSEEFKCKCCGKLPKNGINPKLIELLESIRKRTGKPITVTPHGGYRCEHQNKLSGGAKHSQHLLGNAADIKVSGLTPIEVRLFLKANFDDKIGGMGAYPSFTHVDVRESYARWTG